MTEQEFIIEELNFLDHIKESNLYKTCKNLSFQIDNNEQLHRLNKEKEQILLQADQEKDQSKKRDLLIAYAKKDDEIRLHPLMQQYLNYYEKIKKILNHLTDGLIKEIYK